MAFCCKRSDKTRSRERTLPKSTAFVSSNARLDRSPPTDCLRILTLIQAGSDLDLIINQPVMHADGKVRNEHPTYVVTDDRTGMRKLLDQPPQSIECRAECSPMPGRCASYHRYAVSMSALASGVNITRRAITASGAPVPAPTCASHAHRNSRVVDRAPRCATAAPEHPLARQPSCPRYPRPA